MVEYSWSGTIELIPILGDPWGLGGDTAYSVSVLVEGPDLDPSISRAEFNSVSIELLIDGVAAQVDTLGTTLLKMTMNS